MGILYIGSYYNTPESISLTETSADCKDDNFRLDADWNAMKKESRSSVFEKGLQQMTTHIEYLDSLISIGYIYNIPTHG